MRARCEKAEKEKSEILLRRLTTMETMSNKTSTSEVTKLQKKNEGINFFKFIENAIENFYRKILCNILCSFIALSSLKKFLLNSYIIRSVTCVF